MSSAITVGDDVLGVGVYNVLIPRPANGSYRSLNANVDGVTIAVTREELRALKARLNEMNLE